MGTSTRWKGPNGDPWSSAGRRLARWRDDSRNADQRLEEIAADHLSALYETLRADRSAFGLYDTACAAGERLAGALGSLAIEGAESEDALVARLVSEVGGDGGTLADAAVRRGVAAAVRDVRDRHPELDEAIGGGAAGGGFAWDILCDLYQVFFADMVGEFLRSVVAEHIKLAVPVLIATDPEGRIADWVARRWWTWCRIPVKSPPKRWISQRPWIPHSLWWALCRIRCLHCPRSPSRWYHGRSERYWASSLRRSPEKRELRRDRFRAFPVVARLPKGPAL
ncbi:hypothetical protein E4K10_22760 [Streptomyces sp. T1317-0309]|nr:hypothetical protein E4K10_22760 [Streptomyces sp. T1317-0309]